MNTTIKTMNKTLVTPVDPAEVVGDVRSDVLIQASAGTGKTYQLTERYLHVMIKERCSPEQMLVLTFTDAAAHEMQGRILERISEEIKKSENPSVKAFLVEQKRRFGRHAIGTIHAFAGSVLRQSGTYLQHQQLHPVPEGWEAPPALIGEAPATWTDHYTLLDEYQQTSYRAQWRRAFIKAYAKDAETLTLLQSLGHAHRFFDVLQQLVGIDDTALREMAELSQAQYLDRLKGFYTHLELQFPEVWNAFVAQLEPYRLFFVKDLPSQAAYFFDPESGWLTGKKEFSKRNWNKKAVVGDLDELHDQVTEWLKPLKNIYTVMELFAGVQEAFRTREAAFTTNFATDFATDAEVTGNAPENTDTASKTDLAGEKDAPGEAERQLLKTLKRMAGIALRWKHFTRWQRAREGLMDFDDLIEVAHHVMAHYPEVRQRLQRQYKHILVDEFQDTDNRQWDMIRYLQQGKDENRLFLVGDMKQAIYGFRGGNVSLIRTVEAEIAQTGQNKRMATLMVSHRSNREIVEFVNHFFRHALKPGDSERAYQADYIPLEVKTPENTPSDSSNVDASAKANVNIKGSVRLWKFLPMDKTVVGAESAEDSMVERSRLHPFVDQGASVMDAYHLASFLAELKADTEGLRYPEYVDVGEKLRREEKAVGILVRTQANVDQLTLALRLFGLKAGVRVGSQFFQRQEVSDLYYLLRFLYDAWDDMALVAVLRSPLFGMSDAGLAAMAIHRWEHRDRGAWWNTLMHPELETPLLPPDRSVLHVAIHYLKLWRNQVRSHRVATLLEMALADTPFLVGQSDPDMAKANAYKLIELIRGLEQEGRSGLMEILGWINEQLEATGDADAVLPGTGSIEITTMHRSKGLQYPMVILSHLAAEGRSNTGLYRTPLDLHSEGWPFFAFEVAESEDGENLDKQPTFLKEALKYVNRVRDEAELMRLFYVACTRAESHLILSDTQLLKKGKQKSNLIVKTLQRVQAELVQAQRLQVSTVQEADYRRLLDQLMANIKLGQIKPDTLPIDVPTPSHSEILQPLLTRAQVGIRLPSKSEEASVVTGSLPSPWKILKAEDAGTLVHALFSYPEHSIVSAERRMYQAIARMDYDPRDPLLAEDAREIMRHVACARRLIRQRYPSIKQQFHEHPFEVYIDPAKGNSLGISSSSAPYWLRGSIDLLLQTEDLNWHIVDLKTARLRADEVEGYLQAHHYREQLAYYREAMAVASKRQILVQAEHAVLLFTGVDDGLIV